MALPKLSTPTYELTVPSSGTVVKYRPFLVKEQKLLLMALESKEQKEMLGAMKQIINNCCLDKIDVDNMPMFDLEYFFINLRARSIGESINLKLTHPRGKNSDGDECDHSTDFQLSLLDVNVVKPEGHTNKIILDEAQNVGICLKYPSVSIADKLSGTNSKTQIEMVLDLVADSVDYIFDAENTYSAKSTSKKEIIEFINGLSQEQFKKLTDFYNEIPKLKHEISWRCSKCGCSETVSIEGMSNFFA